MEDLNSRMEKPLSIIRFRPNIVLKGGKPFDEDNWAEIRIGDAGKFWLLARSPRYPNQEIAGTMSMGEILSNPGLDVSFPM